jgi:hypothetical protein
MSGNSLKNHPGNEHDIVHPTLHNLIRSATITIGETHIHISWSVDAWLFGSHLTHPTAGLYDQQRLFF